MQRKLVLAAALLLVLALGVFLVASDHGVTAVAPGASSVAQTQEVVTPPAAVPAEVPDSVPPLNTGSQRAPAETIQTLESSGILLHVVGDDEAPIAGARVRTFEDSIPAELVSNEQGECRLPIGTEHGVFRLEVDAEGFNGFSGQRQSDDEVWVELFRCGVLVGSVLDADTRNPVEGALVRIGWDRQWLRHPEGATTDEFGSFRIEFAPLLDDQNIWIQAEGYPQQNFERNLSGQDKLIEVELLLDRGVELSALVVEHPSGVPIEGARVWSGRTDRAGRADLRVLPFAGNGRIHMDVDAVGFCTLSCSFEPEELAQGSPFVFHLVRPARFEGILRDEEGKPVAGASISFGEEGLAQPANGGEPGGLLPLLPKGWDYWTDADEAPQTDSDGRFVSPPFVPFEPRIYVSAYHFGAELRTVVGPLGGPGTTTWLDLQLTRPLGGTIEGRLLLNGAPCKGDVFWWKEQRSGASEPDPSGNYRLEKVSLGEIEILARLDQERFGHTGDFLPEMRTKVWVEPDRVTRHDFDLALPIAHVGGRVTGEDGLPKEGVDIRIHEPGWRLNSWSATDATGRWEIEVPDIGWEFQASVRYGEESLSIEGIRAGDLDVDFVFPTLGELSLRILDGQNRKPLDGWELAWRRQGEEAFRVATVRSDMPLRPDGSVAF